MCEVVLRHQSNRSTRKQGTANRVGVCIVAFANLLERSLEQVANHNALADVDIAQWVKMDATRLTQIFMWTGIEFFPRMAGCSFNELFRRPAPIHDRTPVLDLTM